MKEQLLIKVLEMLVNTESKEDIKTDEVDLYTRYIGKYVIVRSRSEGINSGYVVEADETGVVLKDARRLWHHKPKNGASWYEGVALYGLSEDSKISVAVKEKAIIEDYSITLCTKVAETSLIEAKAHEN